MYFHIFYCICDGEKFEGYAATGVYVDVFKAVNGCDSTRTLFLTVKPRSFTTINDTICEGESYHAAGGMQTTTGTYYDTLTNYLGCDSIITTNLTVIPLPEPDLGDDRGICIGDTVILDPGNFATYIWQDSSTNSIFLTNTTGHYWVKVSNIYGCTASDEMNILRIDPLPANFLRPDTSLCRGNVLQLSAPGFNKYLWSTGETNASIFVRTPGVYLLQVVDENDCKGTDSVNILFYDCKDVWIPNAFTPDNNGINDIFKPEFPAPVTEYRMRIYNRPGQLMFETTNPLKGWDGRYQGTGQPVGVYVYVVTFKDIDGRDVMKKGIVTLVR